MGLTSRLLLVSLVTLLLPWAGCQYLRDVETALRQGQAESLAANATAVAAGLSAAEVGPVLSSARFDTGRTLATDIYASLLAQRPVLDGFADDWDLPAGAVQTLRSADLSISYAAARRRGSVYLFVEVVDQDVIYGDGRTGDSVRLRVGGPGGAGRDLIFATAAPGAFHPLTLDGQTIRQAEANWQPTSTGYSLEIRLPGEMVGDRIGFVVIDRRGNRVADALGTLPNLAAEPGWLVQRVPSLDAALTRGALPGARLRLVDSQGYVLADSGPVAQRDNVRDSELMRRLVRLAVGSEGALDPAPVTRAGRMDLRGLDAALRTGAADGRFRAMDGGRVLLASARRVDLPAPAVLVAEMDADAVLGGMDRAATRLVLASFAASGAAVLLLFGFAAWLSWRIGRLSGAASRALTQGGEIRPSLPDARSGDELGELSRSFSSLLGRVAEYNAYLKTMGRKLSHELRTPMAVALTSLENLQADPDGPRAAVYLRRAQQGILRLQSMLTALQAATRVEQAIADWDAEPVDLARILGELFTAYVDANPGRDIQVRLPAEPCPVSGSPELIAQMLDKLFENALDFCPPGGRVVLGLERAEFSCTIRVMNTGSQLPDDMDTRLFESMVSARAGTSASGPPHLGLGLYVARLIARHHGADIHARNLPGDKGVEFSVQLPLDSHARL